MADAQYKLKVFSPSGLAYEDFVSEARFESSRGQVGVLPLHIDYTGLLGTGLLIFQPAAGGELKKMVISEGFCYFADEALCLMTDLAILPEAVDQSAYDSARKELQDRISTIPYDDPENQAARKKLRQIEALDRIFQ